MHITQTKISILIGIIIAGVIVVVLSFWGNSIPQKDLFNEDMSNEEVIVPIPAPRPIKGEKRFCIQVVTPACNPETGECIDFGTPCDVPEGWIVGDRVDNLLDTIIPTDSY